MHGIFEALRHDGHPPLYYLLLHGWMSVFGQSDNAVRALSGLFSVATLPLDLADGLASRRPPMRRGGPGLAGHVAAGGALRHRDPDVLPRGAHRFARMARRSGVASCSDVLATARGRGLQRGPVAHPLLEFVSPHGDLPVAVVARHTRPRGGPAQRPADHGGDGGRELQFLPWLPTFFEQIRKTGAPWAAPARPAQVVYSLLVGTDPPGEAQLLGVALAILAVLALFGRSIDKRRIELDVRTRPEVRWESALIVLVLSLAVIGGQVSAVAFAPRYTAVVFPMLILVSAVGVTRMPTRAIRFGVLGAVAALGLAASLHAATVSRTQLGDVGRALGKGARPGDLVVYCPDQLAPSVLRYAPKGLDSLTVSADCDTGAHRLGRLRLPGEAGEPHPVCRPGQCPGRQAPAVAGVVGGVQPARPAV